MSRLSDLINEKCPNGVKFRKIGDVAKVLRGVRVVRSQLNISGDIPVFQNSLRPLGYHSKSNVEGDITFVIGAGAAGEVGYCNKPFWAADDCYYCIPSDSINSRYLYYVISKNKSYLISRVRRASIPRLSRNVIEELVVPVPPLEVQNEIVQILDNFAELTAELSNRKKQYSYYHELLFGYAEKGIKA